MDLVQLFDATLCDRVPPPKKPRSEVDSTTIKKFLVELENYPHLWSKDTEPSSKKDDWTLITNKLDLGGVKVAKDIFGKVKRAIIYRINQSKSKNIFPIPPNPKEVIQDNSDEILKKLYDTQPYEFWKYAQYLTKLYIFEKCRVSICHEHTIAERSLLRREVGLPDDTAQGERQQSQIYKQVFQFQRSADSAIPPFSPRLPRCNLTHQSTQTRPVQQNAQNVAVNLIAIKEEPSDTDSIMEQENTFLVPPPLPLSEAELAARQIKRQNTSFYERYRHLEELQIRDIKQEQPMMEVDRENGGININELPAGHPLVYFFRTFVHNETDCPLTIPDGSNEQEINELFSTLDRFLQYIDSKLTPAMSNKLTKLFIKVGDSYERRPFNESEIDDRLNNFVV